MYKRQPYVSRFFTHHFCRFQARDNGFMGCHPRDGGPLSKAPLRFYKPPIISSILIAPDTSITDPSGESATHSKVSHFVSVPRPSPPPFPSLSLAALPNALHLHHPSRNSNSTPQLKTPRCYISTSMSLLDQVKKTAFEGFKTVAPAMQAPPTVSCFKQKGFLTPEEFVCSCSAGLSPSASACRRRGSTPAASAAA